MTFPLEIVNDTPSPVQLARARIIAGEFPGVCDPEQVERCGLDEDGDRVCGCRCLHEAMASGSG